MLICHFNKDNAIGEYWMTKKSVKNRRFSVFRVEKEVYEINPKLGHRRLLCKRKYPDHHRKKPLIDVSR